MATATASQTTEQVVGLLKDRKAELEAEGKRIDGALAALAATNGKGSRRPGRPRKALTAGKSKPVSKRSRQGGTRAEQAVKLIEKQPGIKAAAIAKAMKIKPNYLYRVLGDLEKKGLVRKDKLAYFPAG